MECMSICSLSSSSSDRSNDWFSSFCLTRKKRGWVKQNQMGEKITDTNVWLSYCITASHLAIGEVEDGQVQAASVRCLPVHGHHVAVIIRQSVPYPGTKQRTVWAHIFRMSFCLTTPASLHDDTGAFVLQPGNREICRSSRMGLFANNANSETWHHQQWGGGHRHRW